MQPPQASAQSVAARGNGFWHRFAARWSTVVLRYRVNRKAGIFRPKKSCMPPLKPAAHCNVALKRGLPKPVIFYCPPIHPSSHRRAAIFRNQLFPIPQIHPFFDIAKLQKQRLHRSHITSPHTTYYPCEEKIAKYPIQPPPHKKPCALLWENFKPRLRALLLNVQLFCQRML